ncbi:biotin transporter BioY [Cellulomonas sp. 73-92]|uniref:biotin transporter BioY n=1 Tax=Cellulomonas sp. 73-92 TaxID=1895740 RepID=UPI000A614151|nr:biotin transporter BioY [Cellulomonas sp. 73-92]
MSNRFVRDEAAGATVVDPAQSPPATPPTTRGRATDLALVAVMAGLVAVCAVAPPVPTGVGVPITLQTFGVLLAGLVLGARRGAAAVGLYVLVGLAGVPVLAGGTGGPGVLAGPTVGYLLGFVPAAAVAGALAGLARRVAPRWRFGVLAGAALIAGLLVVHPLGIAGLVVRAGLPVPAALAADLVFVPGDTVKALVAAAVAVGVLRAFPALLRER